MDAKFQYSIDGGPAIDISSINSIAQLNDATSSLTDGNTQAINVLNNFSLPVALAP